ncbi:hypothetical protein LTS13_002400 [Exophiala xenobiotica]|nr:hypothetical protein LTS13_002400 [Exophiala xenobiotica]KAK5416440.1 hypothetical protein LTR90_005661 [Exophiala xenobiotica]KAK5511983.1 hypothetical protein LTR21_006400 [Exophiala xenobiotica]
MSTTDPHFTPKNTTMNDLHSGFHFDTTPHKRKRRNDDPTDDPFSRSPKRRPVHCLPIRLSPSRPRPQSQAFSMFTSIYQPPPTPVDTSEDESPSEPREESLWPSKSRSVHDSQGSNSSTSSLKAQCGDVDVDMDMTSTAQPKIRRARSNDIMPPQRDTNFLSVMDTFARERVPTPISSHFDNRVTDLPSVPRHQFPPLRTNLSPMIEQDSWIGRDGLPSPVEDHDMDSMMVDQSSDDMTQGQSTNAQPEKRYGLQLDGSSSPGRSRTARLHMGFLNGCEKCIQKVPGHYSHILWS